MNNIESPTKIKNRKVIIDAAKILFIKKGIAATTMIDIAVAANVERKTVYNHFSTKDLIAKQIFVDSFSEVFILITEEMTFDSNQTGFDKIAYCLKEMISTFFKHKENFIFMNHYDYYFRENVEKEIVLNLYNNEQFEMFFDYWNQGVKDGSINLNNKDSDKLLKIIMNALLAYVLRMFFRGHIIEEETGIGIDSIYTFYDLLLIGIKGKS